MYAQIMFWNSYFRNFPSTEEPWGQAIWGLPAESGWPSFALLWNLGWSKGKLPLPALFGAPGEVWCSGFLAEKQILSLNTHPQLTDLRTHDAKQAYVHWSCQDILVWPPLSVCLSFSLSLVFWQTCSYFYRVSQNTFWIYWKYVFQFLLHICPTMSYT